MPKFVIAEDEVIIAMAYTSILQGAGFEFVGRADNGSGTLKLISDHPPDLLVLDIQLKGDMTGLDVAHLLRKTNDMPIVFTTGNSPKLIREIKAEISNSIVLIKPVDEGDLVDAAKSLLG